MTEQANRIDWLERQLAQVKTFIARDLSRYEETPKPSIRLSLESWISHEEDLQQELRLAKEAWQKEVIELRLLGMRMDGSIPMSLLSKLSDKLNRALSYAAYHLLHGRAPSNGISDRLAQDLDLRLSGLAQGSTRLLFAGNISPDAAGESILEGALEQIFEVLQAPTQDKIRDLVTVIGVPATKALSELLAELERRDIGAELTWPAPNAKVYQWGGNLEAVRITHKRLSTFEEIKPIEVQLEGSITDLKENGALYIRSDLDKRKYKISYNRQQYVHIQQYRLGMRVELRAMMYSRVDPLTGNEISTYKLVTQD
ncbi:hypothetical protein R4J70_25900 [Pseudomonas aeruginosa]|uniref:hypothetical protein n=1 Tax=Pseudomonas aeruginosa TaxID=287 RepID=UPI000EAFA667|nr:hypothetical protein [Pseudomonas aeruginosa]EKV6889134.1 hypothetical protein [Pseudomonas aeruginosa]ELV1370759.1 hypothetical protein [Pseudomonas aeruginosa]MCX3415625.1 hypothetical protein [Pseudomonas aeruginosa]MDE9771459.1 hypothetical protein [Pseudomonas aeruginosa]MDV7783427.1 hypothetical protein [Pseudomonas aeruginosa]